MKRPKIYSVESHDQVLEIWRANKIRNARVLRIDFHCDLRGLLINRKTNRAHRILDRFPELDQGNFLTHAILEGIVKGVRWVHDKPGGRGDDLKTVKYETDVSAVIHRMLLDLRRENGIPIQYEVVSNANWSGRVEEDILDIDWDFFAAREYPTNSIGPRVDAFLSKLSDPTPRQTYVCYSPDYSHPSRPQFNSFVNSLADRFNAEVISLPRPAHGGTVSRVKETLKPIYVPARQLYHTICLALRKRGIF